MKETYIEVQESAEMVMIPIQRLGYEGTPVTVGELEVWESGSIVMILIQQIGYEGIPVFVYVQVDNEAVSDVELVSSKVKFESDETESNATLRYTDDETVEEDQRVSVSLVDAQGGMIASPRTVIIVIKDDDSSFRFLQEVYQVGETTTTLTVTILRSGCLSCVATVDYRTVDSTATSSDYTSSSGTVRFGSGETLKKIDISIINDNEVESQEQFTIELLSRVIVSETRIIILDDDTSVVPRPQPISGLG
ncbi:sodium/calcium exchanger 2-like [Amphiura filiformis]|uniref:sodium/calcium exchanger 2-like n=1 Tax=Amphiura filiformis TaxID=82378 RepID=UPI003B21D02F